ncbi:hypothetical protein NDU88_001840 [Pleurodeles waltl]|uniref:Uncharacterized protein n=1 Tax=Pleurodeles waltl TaxID=8319 RepID=A0AAV7M4A6_PLEWA|nr:hypothetical protein NDU88_001840 [Pleurodeles waltl]
MTGVCGALGVHQTKLVKFALPHENPNKTLLDELQILEKQAHHEESAPTLKDIMTVIQVIWGSLEMKTDLISAEVTLIDMENMSDRVKETEDAITFFSAETINMKQQVKELRATTEVLGAKFEDFEGRSRRNNICMVGVLEKAEGLASNLFIKEIVLKLLHP